MYSMPPAYAVIAPPKSRAKSTTSGSSVRNSMSIGSRGACAWTVEDAPPSAISGHADDQRESNADLHSMHRSTDVMAPRYVAEAAAWRSRSRTMSMTRPRVSRRSCSVAPRGSTRSVWMPQLR